MSTNEHETTWLPYLMGIGQPLVFVLLLLGLLYLRGRGLIKPHTADMLFAGVLALSLLVVIVGGILIL